MIHVRPLLPLKSFWGLDAFGALLYVPAAMWIDESPVYLYMAILNSAVSAASLYARRHGFDFKLCLYAATCRSLPGKGFVLHFPADFAENDKLQKCVVLCQGEFDNLVELFGFAPRGRVAIYLFAASNDIKRITGLARQFGCESDIERLTALPFAGCVHENLNVILLARDSDFRSSVRHELTHIFARRLGTEAATFIREGLATWVEHNHHVPSLNDRALTALKEKGGIEAFLDHALLFEPSITIAYYDIAGNFTDFLIARFGWPAYCQFYKIANQTNFVASFEQVFSMPLAATEALWREEKRY
jgi:hypothetical protein